MTTILLVEDEIALAQIITETLEKHGYRVLHARDGLTALRLHAHHHPDLILLDWMIPALDGLEVLRSLRQVSTTPVVMMTSRSGEADRAISLELGADDYLVKPFRMRELVARLRALLQRVERMQRILNADREKHGLPIGYQNLILDSEQRQALVAGQPVALTSIEFNLLHLLLRNPGRVFSRAYLLETIWDEVGIEGEATVDDIVLSLRRKLGAVGEKIETVLGVGYRLRADL